MAPRRELGKFAVEDKVEVLSSEEGFSDAWALATVSGISKQGVLVEYSKFVDEDGRAIREKVPQHRLRHVPLFPASFNVNLGLRVEGYLHDCWWPGEVAEMHPRKGLRIQFDDGDTAWLVRAKVRPMLRRAPRASADEEADSAKGAFGVRAAPPPRMPLRLPHGINPYDALAAVESILEGSGWQSLRLSEVQAQLEAKLLPDEPAGWMGPWRHALLNAIEHCLLSRLRPDAKARRARRSPSGAGRETKRSRGNGVGTKKLDSHLTRPLMRSSNPDLAVPSAAAFLRECRLTIGGAALVHYVLGCIGPPLLRLLHHEQVSLYNYAPPRHFKGKYSESAAAPPAPADDDDTVPCHVVSRAPRSACDLCATAIFNVHLLAQGAGDVMPTRGPNPGRADAVRLPPAPHTPRPLVGTGVRAVRRLLGRRDARRRRLARAAPPPVAFPGPGLTPRRPRESAVRLPRPIGGRGPSGVPHDPPAPKGDPPALKSTQAARDARARRLPRRKLAAARAAR